MDQTVAMKTPKTLIIVGNPSYAQFINRERPEEFYAVSPRAPLMGRQFETIILVYELQGEKEKQWYRESVLLCLSSSGHAFDAGMYR